MNTLASVLKNQPSYAMDVDKIFTRLHHDQSLAKMNDLLEHIFTESSQSILEGNPLAQIPSKLPPLRLR